MIVEKLDKHTSYMLCTEATVNTAVVIVRADNITRDGHNMCCSIWQYNNYGIVTSYLQTGH